MKWLVAASLVWPLLLATSLTQRLTHPEPWSDLVYLAASRICHQRPERSFHTSGVAWPVCGRCSGLYAAAPIGAIAAAFWRRRRVTLPVVRVGLLLAAVPTAMTLVTEWGGLAPVSNQMRALSALPLGAAVAATLVWVSRPAGRPVVDQVH